MSSDLGLKGAAIFACSALVLSGRLNGLFSSTRRAFQRMGDKLLANSFRHIMTENGISDKEMIRKMFRLSLGSTGNITKNDIQMFWETMDPLKLHSHFEDPLGDKALDWVREQNAHTERALGDPTANPLYNKVLSILDSKDKIPYVEKIGGYYYNFWQDENNARGLWRRTTLQEYKQAEPRWEAVLDIDALGKQENESWVYKGHTILHNDDGSPSTRTLLSLSRGGADAHVTREFDLEALRFVEDEGFVVPEAKSYVSWLSKNTLLVGTNFSSGDPLTDSGYPRDIRLLRRGQTLDEAVKVFETAKDAVLLSGYTTVHRGVKLEWRTARITFYTSSWQIRFLPLLGKGSSHGQEDYLEDYSSLSEWHSLNECGVPSDSEVTSFGDQLLITLRSDLNLSLSNQNDVCYPSGSLLAVDIMDLVTKKLSSSSSLTVIFSPSPRVSLDTFTATNRYLILELLDNVKSRIEFWSYSTDQKESGSDRRGRWTFEQREDVGVIRGTSISAVDSLSATSDFYWITTSSFTKPPSLGLADAKNGVRGVSAASVGPIKSRPPQFDHSDLLEEQGEAISKDGTAVPYMIIRKKDMKLDGQNPTLLYGYGGFLISLLPSYAPVTGLAWLESGGVYVSANIRGGGEFGPEWHQAALKANRNKAYEDFIAVAESLIANGVTSPNRLAIRGGSNGGLLMGNMFVARPDLFGAVICQVPLLDMRRFNHLLAGASWMAEYGDPDKPDQWAYIRDYSPYHNIDPRIANPADKGKEEDGIVRYPPLLMTTSTRDDRVHPYHARAFVKRLNELDAHDVYYYENIEGGHGGAADNKQVAYVTVLYIDFLNKTIGVGK